MGDTKELEKTETKETSGDSKVILLHNDDHNSFNHVENCLIEICKHSPQQASQVSLIVHYRGKCDVKRGVGEEINRIFNELKSKSLTVTLEND